MRPIKAACILHTKPLIGAGNWRSDKTLWTLQESPTKRLIWVHFNGRYFTVLLSCFSATEIIYVPHACPYGFEPIDFNNKHYLWRGAAGDGRAGWRPEFALRRVPGRFVEDTSAYIDLDGQLTYVEERFVARKNWQKYLATTGIWTTP